MLAYKQPVEDFVPEKQEPEHTFDTLHVIELHYGEMRRYAEGAE